MDDGSAFCERCGLDSDRLGSAGARDFRVCPDCGSSNCANCWNQVAGRCLACSPFHLASAPTRAPRRITPAATTQPVTAAPTPRRGAEPRRPSRATAAARAAAVEAGVAAGVAAGAGGRLARRGLSKVARLSLFAVIVVAGVVGVRAVTFTGGTVAAQDQIAETLAPAFPASSGLVAGAPEASAPAARQDPSEPPAERHQGSDASTSSGGGSNGGGGGGGGSGGGGAGGATPGLTPSPGPTETPGPRGTPIPTPDPGTPTPDPATPTPDPGTPTPDPATPTPDPGTPTPDPPTPSPDPPTPDPTATP